MTAPEPGPEHLRGWRMRDYDDLIATLARSRESQRISLRALAEHTDCSAPTLSENLRGLHRMDALTALQLADALGYDLALIPRDAEPARCARVGRHNCSGEWRNHDRANDLPEPGGTAPQRAPASTLPAEPTPPRDTDTPGASEAISGHREAIEP